ncbi:MAG: radical SAM protein [Clostridia bacterium]|nr:radical SAM protein [Clostridia bacterium]
MSVTNCTLCPRKCKVNRSEATGFCGANNQVKLAKAYLHKWEEPCISGENGSGTVFFSGCQLRCCFCQNYEVSRLNTGKVVSVERLARIFTELQCSGAHNINLITPTPYVPMIIDALNIAKPTIPVVYNCGGYESVDTISKLCGYVDVYMPDVKFFKAEYSGKYLKCTDYFDKAIAALEAMIHQVGKPKFDEKGNMVKGVIVRHLVMPSMYKDSIQILNQLYEKFGNDKFLLSLMSQYTPCGDAGLYPEINRKVTTLEYNKVVDTASKLGFEGFCQDKSSAVTEYIPKWDYEGV